MWSHIVWSDINTKARRTALMDVLLQTILLFWLFYLALALRPNNLNGAGKQTKHHTCAAHNHSHPRTLAPSHCSCPWSLDVSNTTRKVKNKIKKWNEDKKKVTHPSARVALQRYTFPSIFHWLKRVSCSVFLKCWVPGATVSGTLKSCVVLGVYYCVYC